MKTAISVPDDLMRRAMRFAESTGRSRSGLFSDALRDFLDRHGFDEVTEAMNAAVDAARDADENADFVRAAAHRTAVRNEW